MNSGVKSTNRTPTWLKGKSNSERHLILLTTVICLFALALAIALGIVVHKNSKNDARDVCWTPGCIQAAADTMSYMDMTADPCDDFYQFACGTFQRETLIPEDKSSISSFSVIGDKIRDQLKMIISDVQEHHTSKPYKLLKKFYDLCMNTTAIEIDGLTTVKRILKDLGGWPVLEGANWNEGRFDWKLSVYKFRKLGFSTSHFIGFNVGTDDRNSSRRVINLDQGMLGLSREFLIKGMDEQLVKAYYNFLVDVAVIFGANKAVAEREIKESLEFEIELAKICLPKEQRRNATALYNPMTVEQLQHNFPFINWMEYIKNVLDVPDIEITYDEVVVVQAPKYIADLEGLMRRTAKRVQSNYVMTKAVLSTLYFLTREIRDKMTEYFKILSGQTERESRWKECTRFASSSVYLAAGSLYVRKYFKEEAKHNAEEMVSDILTQFKKILKDVDWMDDNTKRQALAKAAAITPYIGYPDELLDDKNLEKFYANIDDSSNSFMTAYTAFSLFFRDYYNKQLREPVNKTDWKEHAFPTVVNAYYLASENSIQFPAGILQGVFFGNDRPHYMNYGGIGYVIGHEIIHGFDDQGREYDKDGNLYDWWADSTKEAFIKKTQCIVDQYGNITVPEIEQNLNGVNSQGENIADNGGLKQAYLAYLSWVDRHGPEKKLPGLPYTPNQMFWVSAAQTWCSKTRKEVLKLQVTTGYHVPEKYRVLTPFSNTESFSKDFNCPVGSAMNPIKKCNVW